MQRAAPKVLMNVKNYNFPMTTEIIFHIYLWQLPAEYERCNGLFLCNFMLIHTEMVEVLYLASNLKQNK